MAFFSNYNEFAFHSIEESLLMAGKCLKTPKGIFLDSCHGMAALILISSAMDTIGMFYRHGFFEKITDQDVAQDNNGSHLGGVKEHFKQYRKFFLSYKISEKKFLDKFYTLARCRANHNSILGKDVRITVDSSAGKDIFTYDGATLIIHLNELLDSVWAAFDQIKRAAGYTSTSIQDGSLTGTTK